MKENPKRKTEAAKIKEPLRLVALSDGLFATVLTLLVLDLRIPDAIHADPGGMAVFLKWLGPHLFSYLLTFFVAGNYWLAHHRDFDYITHYDRRLLGYNLLFLLFVGLFPFSTASVSQVGFSNDAYPTYWAIYCANIILAGILLTLTWGYAMSHGQVEPETTREQSRHIIVRQMTTPAVFLISIGAEFLFPQAFLGPYTLMTIPLAQWSVDRFFGQAESMQQPRRKGWTDLLWRAGTSLIWLLLIAFAIWAMTL
jgi:TMEM175 potassium channel family protein